MARLNEPVAPMENIESLKRKFMRQNRDIARVNSTQSIRIRNLENEVSNLLSENLALREQLTRYKLELEGGRAQRIADHTGEVKAQLEEKLQELSDLINGLGHAPRPKKPSPKRGKITIANPSQSPNSKAWKNETAEQEGRLPPIIENKTYPRKTLEHQELLDLVVEADATDSPEIGPPPVSKFVDEEPVKIDLPKRTRPHPSEEIPEMDPSLSINLEQRRRRKDSGGSSESRRSSQSEFAAEDFNAMGPLNTGERSSRPEAREEETTFVANPKPGSRQSRHEPITEESSSRGILKGGGRSNRHESLTEEPGSVATVKTGGRSNREEMVEDTNSISNPKTVGRLARHELSVENQGSTVTIKIGGKRKLSVREDEEKQALAASIESPDDFKFSRVPQDERGRTLPSTHSERPMAKPMRELAVAKGLARIKPSEPMLPSNRKVLAPKSVNNSPKKAKHAAINEESKSSKADAPKFNPTKDRRERRHEPIQITTTELAAPAPKTIIIQPGPELEPETPADFDMFSPQPSRPSTTGVDSRDTPPPTELGPGTEGQRPNRRARGAVSYAEPNLRDKMRRPTKDLTDAVGRDDKGHRGSSVKLEEGMMDMDVKIKEEPQDGWREVPAALSATTEGSPLRTKTSVPDCSLNSTTTYWQRRESLLTQLEVDNHTSGSGSAIAALLAETRKAKAVVREKGKERPHEGDVANGMSRKENFEYKDHTPYTEHVAKNTRENKVPSRVSRRHSTMPHEPTPEDSEASDMEAAKKTDVQSTRRRQSSLAIKSSSSRNDITSRETNGEKNLKRSSTTAGAGESGSAESRSERMSARRRSMML